MSASLDPLNRNIWIIFGNTTDYMIKSKLIGTPYLLCVCVRARVRWRWGKDSLGHLPNKLKQRDWWCTEKNFWSWSLLNPSEKIFAVQFIDIFELKASISKKLTITMIIQFHEPHSTMKGSCNIGWGWHSHKIVQVKKRNFNSLNKENTHWSSKKQIFKESYT